MREWQKEHGGTEPGAAEAELAAKYEQEIGKNAHISRILSLLQEREGISLLPSQILLIDDDFDNRQRANASGYHTLEMFGEESFLPLNSIP